MCIGVAQPKTPDVYTITHCYGRHETVFGIPIAAGDSVKYMSFVYGNFEWGIHVRYNKKDYGKSGVTGFI